MPFLTREDGVALHYEEAGAGKPLVLLHGWCMSGGVWRRLGETLSDRYRVILPDLRGHGASTGGDAISLAALAADVAALFEHLELDEAVLAGWSLGAQVALAATPAMGARLRALCLVGGTPKFTADASWPHGLPSAEARGMAVRIRRNYFATMEDFFRRMFAPGEVSPEAYRLIARETARGGANLPTPEVALRALHVLDTADLRDVVATITCPTLLVHGCDDTICLPGASAWMAERLPSARLELIPGAGHAPFLAGMDGFLAILEKFLCSLR